MQQSHKHFLSLIVGTASRDANTAQVHLNKVSRNGKRKGKQENMGNKREQSGNTAMEKNWNGKGSEDKTRKENRR